LAAVFEEAAQEKTASSNIGGAPIAVLSEREEEQEKAAVSHQDEPLQSGSSHDSSPLKTEPIVTKLATVRQRTRKSRAWLIGIVALTLFSLLIGSTAFAALTLVYNGHNPFTAKVPSTTPTHAPAAKATATITHTPTATAIPTTPAQPPTAPVPIQLTSSANFTIQPPIFNNMTPVTNDAIFQGGYSILGAGGQVVVDFSLLPHANTATLYLTGLVSQNGPDVTGSSPISISCNGQVVTSNFTMPGNGGTGIGPSTAQFTISQCLIQGNNLLQFAVSPNAVTNFWLYNLSVTQSN
ncbi:MAG TPA: hypothetical protein VH593_08910, partial [Ktedonobacteraceae bacterium]